MLGMTISCLTYDRSVNLYRLSAQAYSSKRGISDRIALLSIALVLSRTHVKESSKGGNHGISLLFARFGDHTRMQ